jgi:hypothetical protein
MNTRGNKSDDTTIRKHLVNLLGFVIFTGVHHSTDRTHVQEEASFPGYPVYAILKKQPVSVWAMNVLSYDTKKKANLDGEADYSV